jgi:chemotaxis methyl-accepting protein methylase
MVERRINCRLTMLGISEPTEYLDRLRRDPAELDCLIEAISINVTSFFRNPVFWEILAQSVVPALIEQKQATRSRELRIWSAGCASGEEAYSIAIVLHETLRDELSAWKTHIFGTDISEQVLKTAARGAYPRERMENTRLGILEHYFTCKDGVYEVLPFVRRMVWFSRDDLTSARLAPVESIFGSFDLILCRNVLIYFARPLQNRVLEKLTRSMAAGGYLALGESELIEKDNDYGLTVVDRRNHIYQKNKDSVPAKRRQRGEASHA